MLALPSSARSIPNIAIALCFAARIAAAPPEIAPPFEWGTSASRLKNDRTHAINIEREGNVFLAGDATLKTAGALRWNTQGGGDKLKAK